LKGPKPTPAQWIQGRKSSDKLNLMSWLIDGCPDFKDKDCISNSVARQESLPEFQTFDGFFNNIFQVELGAVGRN